MDSAGLENNSIRLNELPDEIIEFILTYLPPYADLESSRLVCKRWNGIIKNLIRRSKMNLHKGLLDFRLRWETFAPQSTTSHHHHHHHNHTKTSVCGPQTNNSNNIAGRFSHSAVRYGNSMYVFGGGSSSDTTFNDLWRFDLSEMRWDRPISMGSYPSPKGSASMVCWRDQLVLFGGWRYPSLHPPYQPWCLFDELHYYDIMTQRWIVRVPEISPPPMAGHSASVHGDLMVVFGGYQISDGINSNSNEIWCLDLHDYKWWQPILVGNTKPPPRYGQFQLELDKEHLLIVGGCGGPNAVYSDAWLLDMSQRAWKWRAISVRNKKYAAPHMWCNPACKIDSMLVVLGPTPNMPQDFQLMRQTRVPVTGGMPSPRLIAMPPQNNHNGPFVQQQNGGPAIGGGGAGRLRIIPREVNRLDNGRLFGGGVDPAAGPFPGPNDQYYANRRAILNQHQQNANNNLLNSINNITNNNLQPRTGSLRDLHSPTISNDRADNRSDVVEERNQNRPSTSSNSTVSTFRSNGSSSGGSSTTSPNNSQRTATDNDTGPSINNGGQPDIEAANRLQRNLALRCRHNDEASLPKRFDEFMYEDPIRMAAFKEQNHNKNLSRDHNERIRRLEEKMNAIRNSRRNVIIDQQNKSSIKEPSPKRIKRNVLSLFVCDLTGVLDADEPHIRWVEYKNYGIISGAPERHILSTMVAGHGELILFGGVHKETLSELTHQVSNTVHFLSAPRDII